MVKPFVTGLIRMAETLRESYRQKQRKECEDFHDRHVQVGGLPLYYPPPTHTHTLTCITSYTHGLVLLYYLLHSL